MSVPELPSVSAEPFVLRCSGPHFLKRLFAHLLIRLLVFGTLPAPLQLHALAFPASLLWSLPQLELGHERPERAPSEAPAPSTPDHVQASLCRPEWGSGIVNYANDNPTRFVDPTGHDAELVAAAEKEKARRAGLTVHAKGTIGANQGSQLTEGEVLVRDRSSKLERDIPSLERGEVSAPAETVEEERSLLGRVKDAWDWMQRPITPRPTTGDPGEDVRLAKEDAFEFTRKVGEYGAKGSEFGLSVVAGTAGDVVTAYGIDPITGEEVDTATRWIAVAGALIPGLSATDLKIAKESAETARGLARANRSPLGRAEKDALRTGARDAWQQMTGRRAIWDDLEVHHRIPLEWSHLFPADPNRVANLAGVPNMLHSQISTEWNAWRKSLGDTVPTPSQVMQQALRIDDKYGSQMRFPK